MHSSSALLAPLLSAKGRVPLLPSPYIPRPQPVAVLTQAVRTHRLVLLTAGALAGKTTLLIELAGALASVRVCWYSVDAVDDSPGMALEGMALALTGAMQPGDELTLLAQVVGALAAEPGALLILDDVHRAPGALEAAARLLQYLPPHVTVLLSGHSSRGPLPEIVRWLEDRGQMARFGPELVRLNAEEQARFRSHTGRVAGAWAVEYRSGGEPAAIDSLHEGVLPSLAPDARQVVNQLAVLPAASPAVLAAVLGLPAAVAEARLRALAEETILVERLDGPYYRLTGVAQRAVLRDPEPAAIAALRLRTAEYLAASDPLLAAQLFVACGEDGKAMSAARHVTLWGWHRQQAGALAFAGALPPALVRRGGALALVLAYRRLLEAGPDAAWALLLPSSSRLDGPLERIERLRLLALCCAGRDRRASVRRAERALASAAAAMEAARSHIVRAYALAGLGTARGLLGEDEAAARALRASLALLAYVADDAGDGAIVRRLAVHTLAVVERRLGHLDLAERLYQQAQAAAMNESQVHSALELLNNRAVLLQQLGRHEESADLLQQGLASPWCSAFGVRPLLRLSRADALAALGDSVGAIELVSGALAELETADPYRLAGSAQALLALLCVGGDRAVSAAAELAPVASGDLPAARLARALLADPRAASTCAEIEAVVLSCEHDAPLRAQARAHLARLYALQGRQREAHDLARSLVHDKTYSLTPRERAILGALAMHPRPRRVLNEFRPPKVQLRLRFFGQATVFVDGQNLGSTWWHKSKARELLWYALAHGKEGFSREQAYADLFPEQDTVSAGRSLRNLLYELRRLLRESCGATDVLREEGGRLWLLPTALAATWTSDLVTLAEHRLSLQHADLAGVSDLPLSLGGRYLADIGAEWVRPFRYYWEREAVEALEEAATLCERAGMPIEALACLRREVDFCADDPLLVQRLLHLYRVLGDAGGLRATYLQHQRAMRQELDADPDEEVTALYRILMS